PHPVQEGEGLDEKSGLAADRGLGHPGSVVLPSPAGAAPGRQHVQHHEADVVTRAPVAVAGVAEADHEPHLRELGDAAPRPPDPPLATREWIPLRSPPVAGGATRPAPLFLVPLFPLGPLGSLGLLGLLGLLLDRL